MVELRKQHPKLDMPEAVIRQFASPPHNPQDCVFALTTQTLSADLQTKITPCQFGGILIVPPADASPPWACLHCRSQAGRNALRWDHFQASVKIGQMTAKSKEKYQAKDALRILQVKEETCVNHEQSRN